MSINFSGIPAYNNINRSIYLENSYHPVFQSSTAQTNPIQNNYGNYHTFSKASSDAYSSYGQAMININSPNLNKFVEHVNARYYDARPGYTQKDYCEEITSAPTSKEFHENWLHKGRYLATATYKPLDSSMDFSQSKEYLRNLSFFESTFRDIPTSQLPQGFDPKQIIELGKDPGLNTRKVHQKGITGKGQNIAIIDVSLPPNANYDSNIVSYNQEANAGRKDAGQMHGAAIASIVAGKENGILPDANVYYFAACSDPEFGQSDDINSLKKLIETNKKLPDNEKIKVVIKAGPLADSSEEGAKLKEELKAQGVWVFDADEFWKNFGYLEKKDALGNPDDFDNYRICHKADDTGAKLYVNSGDRTVSHFSPNAEFRHDSKASASWAIPVVASYYTMACEVDPNMTPEKFMKLANETAQIKTSKDSSSDKIADRGQYELMYEIAKKQNSNLSRQEFDKIADKSSYLNEVNRLCNESEQSYMYYSGRIQKLGEEALMAEGKLDVNYELIDRADETIKIIDIEALIDKIQAEKNK